MKQVNITWAAFAAVLCSAAAVAGCPEAPDAPAANSPAAAWLAAQVDGYGSRLYVYSDYSDSRNAFTQRGVMASGGIEEPQMNEASPRAFSGITSICVDAPLSRGCWSGYYFGNGIQAAGGAPQFDWGDTEAGMDLRGAVRLVFHARSEEGQTAGVNFFVGGNGSGKPFADTDRRETGYLTLTPEWQTFEIGLDGLDLSRISGGFGWVTSDANNPGRSRITFYLDDIYYEFASARPGPVFPASYEAVPLDREGYFINSVAYSYDLAVSILALSYAGRHEQALRIADGLLFALYNDRKFSPPERGLRNGYATDNPASFPGWVSASGKAPFARLAGFYDPDSREWWEDYYSDSHSTGNNAWAILAFLEVWRQSGNSGYLEAACSLADCIHALKDAGGGFRGGWEGFDDSQQQATYVSTEHCIDIYSAFTQLAGELEKAPPAAASPGRIQTYRDDAAHARAFAVRMYDPAQGLFYTGTRPDGVTVNRDVYPLDVNTWGLMAFHDDPDIHPERILATIESRFGTGGLYDFNDDLDGVWNEGSCQKIIVEKVLGNTARYRAQLALVNAAATAAGSIAAAGRDGLTTGIWLEGVNADGSHKGNEWKYSKRIHTGATAWLALAQLGVNPLDPRRTTGSAVRPAAAQAQAGVSGGRLYVTGLPQNTPVKVYSPSGREILRSETSAATFTCDLPSRGAYIVTAGAGSWKVVY
jgi:hypothetical protein